MSRYFNQISVICLYKHPMYPFTKDFNPVDDFLKNTKLPVHVRNPFGDYTKVGNRSVIEEYMGIVVNMWKNGEDLFVEIESNLRLPGMFRYVPLVHYSVGTKNLRLLDVYVDVFDENADLYSYKLKILPS